MNGLGIGVVRISGRRSGTRRGFPWPLRTTSVETGLFVAFAVVGIVIGPCRASGTGRQKERYYKGPHEDGSTFYHRGISSHLISYLYFILYDRKFPCKTTDCAIHDSPVPKGLHQGDADLKRNYDFLTLNQAAYIVGRTKRVKTVATKRPLAMVDVHGTPEDFGQQRHHAQYGRRCCQHDGPEAQDRRIDDGVPRVFAGSHMFRI